MQLRPIQHQILSDPSRFKIVVAGRRGGKTYTAISAMAQAARHPNQRVMYVAPSYRMAKQIVWEDLKQMLGDRNWVKGINESELTIKLINNSQIMLRSADNPDSIRGVGLNFVVVDEAADISEEAWRAVIRPTLSDREGSALIITSPKGRNWVYDVFNDAKHLPEWFALQYTTAQGGNVSESELAQARQDLDPKTFAQEYEAEFVNYSGVIYYAFSEANIKRLDIPMNRVKLHIGCDFNIDPMSAVVFYQHNSGLHIVDEIEIYGSNTTEMVSEISERYPDNPISVYPDASGAQRRSSANGITDHIILKNAGFDLRVGSVNPAVRDRIAAVNSVLASGRLTVQPECRRMIDTFRKQTYKEGTRQPDKTSGLDHLADACGYCVNHIFPIRQDINKVMGAGPLRRSTGRYTG